MYWLTRLDSVNSFFCGIGDLAVVITIIAMIVSTVCYTVRQANSRYHSEDSPDSDYLCANSVLKIFFPVGCFTACLAFLAFTVCVFIPTTKEMAAIKVVPVLAGPESAEKIQKLSSDILDAAREWMDEVKAAKSKGDASR